MSQAISGGSGGMARPPPSKPAWCGVLLHLTVVGVSGEGDGAGDPGEVPVTSIVLSGSVHPCRDFQGGLFGNLAFYKWFWRM